jgi:aspartate/methionine/tyrosine aminotransferase
MLQDGLNSFTGIKCNVVEGAMYAFPSIQLSPKFIEAAKKAGKQPDTFYCLQLLDETGQLNFFLFSFMYPFPHFGLQILSGIVVVPGSGFGQRPGTYHFRTTILPPLSVMPSLLEKFKKFHENLMKKYA